MNTARYFLGSIACLLASVTIFFLSLNKALALKEKLLSADMLYIPALVEDTIMQRGSINDWFFAPSPEIFTEIPFYFLFHLLLPSIQSAVFGYAAAQVVFTALICFVISYFLFRNKASFIISFSLACAFGSIFLLGIDNALHVPFYHYATYIDGLILLVFLLTIDRWLATSSQIIAVSVMALLLSLIISSGFIIVAWFVIPISVVLALTILVQRAQRVLNSFILVALWCAVIFGRELWSLLPHKVDPRLMSRTDNSELVQRLQEPSELLNLLTSYIPEYLIFQLSSVPRLLAFATLILMAFITIFKPSLFQQIFRGDVDNCRFSRFTLYSLAVVVVNVGLFSLHDQQPVRYMIAANYMPAIYMVVFGVLVTRAWFRDVPIGLGVLVISGTLFARAASASTDWSDAMSYRPKLISCLEQIANEHGLRNGIGQYWQARPARMLSGGNLHVAQIDGETIKPYWWANSRNEFLQTYDFVLIDHAAGQATSAGVREKYFVNRDRIIRLNGPPLVSITCDQTEVMIYGNGKVRTAKKLVTIPRRPLFVKTQVYFETVNGNYSEEKSKQRQINAKLGDGGLYTVNENIVFQLGDLGDKPMKFRIDPVDGPGEVQLKNVRLSAKSQSGERTLIFELNHEHGADSASRSLNQLRNHGGKSLYFYADGYDPWLNIIPPRDFAGQLIDVQLEYQLLWTEFEDSIFQTLFR